MKKLAFIFALAILLLAACQAAPSPQPAPPTDLPPTAAPSATATTVPTVTATPEPPTPTATAAPVVLELAGPDGEKALTMADLQAMTAYEGQAGIKSSTGRITLPSMQKGVLLEDLIDLVGGLDPEYGINVVAKDGYGMTISYDQIKNSDFIAYDPATGEERTMEEPLKVIVAYEQDGKAISEQDGPLRLAFISPKNNQVVDGHWAVKWVTRIELQPLGAEWGLELHGAIDDTIDRNTFQSCSAPGCHQATWIDEEGQQWTGTPLYLLAGRVDDEIKHDGPAFFDLLAQLGYNIQVVASDGYSTTLEISRVAYSDNNILLASQVDGAALPEKYFPLRLVGPELQKNERIGAVEQINLIFDPAKATQAFSLLPTKAPTATPEPSPTPEPAPATSAQLTIIGLVEQELALNESDLRSMEIIKLDAEHPKKGMQTYEGVRLSALLELAGIKAAAAKVIFTAADGYASELPLADLQACSDCLLAFTDTEGSFQLVMPGLPSSIWVKDLARIEIQ